MAIGRVPRVAPSWRVIRTHVVLWHGTVRTAANDILANGIDLTRSRHATDFGPGFYTTTSRRQARDWARNKYRRLPPILQAADRPALVEFHVALDRLATLESLMFVRGDARSDGFWAFVSHCRSSPTGSAASHLHPGRPVPNDSYDVVCGPVAAMWPPQGKWSVPNSDQFSFHTAAGVAILDSTIGMGAPQFQIHPL